MKPLLHFASVFFVSISLSASEPANEWQGKKVPQLILANGKTYTEVTFTKVEPDAITITHAGGILRIPMEDLKPEAQEALGYDPAKAAEARKAYEAHRAAEQSARAKRVAAEQAAMALQAATEEWRAASQVITIKVTQIIDGDGILGFINDGDEISFVELDTDAYTLHDGWYGTLTAVPMKEPYRYTSVLGAAKTVQRWVLFEE